MPAGRRSRRPHDPRQPLPTLLYARHLHPLLGLHEQLAKPAQEHPDRDNPGLLDRGLCDRCGGGRGARLLGYALETGGDLLDRWSTPPPPEYPLRGSHARRHRACEGVG